MGEVATELAAAERGIDAGVVDEDTIRSVRVSLVHSHLPKLVDLGLVVWDRDAETVAPTDHPAYEDALVRQLVDARGAEWDAILDCVADVRRRQLLRILNRADRALSLVELADEMTARDAGNEENPTAADVVKRNLHHVHLPKLDRADLVDYDRDERTVTYRGHPELPDLASV